MAKEKATLELSSQERSTDELNNKEYLINQLNTLIEERQVPCELIEKWCKKDGIDRIDELDIAKMQLCIEYIDNNYPQV